MLHFPWRTMLTSLLITIFCLFAYVIPGAAQVIMPAGAGLPTPILPVAPQSVLQPDAKIRAASSASYLGDGVYNADGTNQTLAHVVTAGTAMTYYVQVQNDGNAADSISVTGPSAPNGWTVAYYTPAGTPATDQVTNLETGWSTSVLSPQASTYLRVVVQPGTGVVPGTAFELLVTARSLADSGKLDAVKATVAVRKLQPDAKIRLAAESSYLGDNLYNLTAAGQTKSLIVLPNGASTFYVQVQNDGNVADSLIVTAPLAPAGWTVKYFNPAGTEVSGQVTNPAVGWTSELLDPAKYSYLRLTVQPSAGVAAGAECALLLTVRSTTSAAKADAVKAVVAVRKYQPDLKIRPATESTYVGDNVYDPNGISQTVTTIGEQATYSYYVQVQNDGNVPDSFIVTGLSGTDHWVIYYYAPGGAEITEQVTQGGWSTGTLAPQAATFLRVVAFKQLSAPRGSTSTVPVVACSAADANMLDCVKSISAWANYQPDGLIRAAGVADYAGENIYNTTGAQQTAMQWAAPGNTVKFFLRIQNDGNVPDTYTVTGPGSAGEWTIKYLNATGSEIGIGNLAGWSTGTIAPGGTALVTVCATLSANAATSSSWEQTVTLKSTKDVDRQDAVRLVINKAPTPILTLTAAKTSLLYGEQTTLSWESNGATQVASNFGTSALSGTRTVSPTGTTTYSLSATGPGGTVTRTVTVSVAAVRVAITPSPASIGVTKSLQLTATVTGAVNKAVDWQVVETNGGTVTTGGLYTAPATEGTYHVKATSTAKPTATATVTITVESGEVIIIIE